MAWQIRMELLPSPRYIPVRRGGRWAVGIALASVGGRRSYVMWSGMMGRAYVAWSVRDVSTGVATIVRYILGPLYRSFGQDGDNGKGADRE